MSRILRNKKKIIAILICGLLVILKCYVLALLFALILLLNWKMRKILSKQSEPFSNSSKIRNVDYLIIGDLVNAKKYVPEGKSFVQISSYRKSFGACYEILRHTSSILNEESSNVLFFVEKKKLDSNEITLFDIPYFSNITVENLNLQKKRKQYNYPILFAPIKSLIQIIGVNKEGWYKTQEVTKEVIDFCEERNIFFTLMSR